MNFLYVSTVLPSGRRKVKRENNGCFMKVQPQPVTSTVRGGNGKVLQVGVSYFPLFTNPP